MGIIHLQVATLFGEVMTISLESESCHSPKLAILNIPESLKVRNNIT